MKYEPAVCAVRERNYEPNPRTCFSSHFDISTMRHGLDAKRGGLFNASIKYICCGAEMILPVVTAADDPL